jgi:hypothetical protein
MPVCWWPQFCVALSLLFAIACRGNPAIGSVGDRVRCPESGRDDRQSMFTAPADGSIEESTIV